jgi:hypothetical protein
MDRLDARRISRTAGLILLAAMLAQASGCASSLAGLMYVIDPNDRPAEFNDLKGKRVAVVCRPPADLSFSDANAGRELARQVGMGILQNVKRVDVIDPEEVAQWTDENTWDDYAEIGRALKADVVVALDLESFSLYQHQTLYQGKSNVRIRVFDLTGDKSQVVYDKIPPQFVYPPNTGIATQDMQESEFRRQYVGALAGDISRRFHKFESRSDFAKDTEALK